MRHWFRDNLIVILGERIYHLGSSVVMVHLADTLSGLSLFNTRLAAYPADIIKTRIQTDSLMKSNRKYQSISHCATQIIRSEGFRGFYKGFLPCFLRAAPVNGLTFVGFELAMRMIG